VQLSITGNVGKVHQVLLPAIVSRSLLSLRGDAGANDPVFASRKHGGRLTERAVNEMVKRAAKAASINEAIAAWRSAAPVPCMSTASPPVPVSPLSTTSARLRSQ
jgi:hypothetical protein